MYEFETNDIRRGELLHGLQKFDVWLSELDGRRRLYINPLSFANETHSSWAIAMRIFDDAHDRNMLAAIYQYHDPMTYEVLYSSTDRSEMIQTKFTDEYGNQYDIPTDYIEVVYSLKELPSNPTQVQSSHQVSRPPLISPPYTRNTIKQSGDEEAIREMDCTADLL